MDTVVGSQQLTSQVPQSKLGGLSGISFLPTGGGRTTLWWRPRSMSMKIQSVLTERSSGEVVALLAGLCSVGIDG